MYVDQNIRSTHGSSDMEQRLKITSKMMMVEELTDAIGIVTYKKALTFRKHLKRSFLTGRNALPVYIKDAPKGTLPSMRGELTLILLKQEP